MHLCDPGLEVHFYMVVKMKCYSALLLITYEVFCVHILNVNAFYFVVTTTISGLWSEINCNVVVPFDPDRNRPFHLQQSNHGLTSNVIA